MVARIDTARGGPAWRSAFRRGLMLVLVVSVATFSVACGDGASDAVAVPTVERDDAPLLPPSSVATDSQPAAEADAVTSVTVEPSIPAATATPDVASLQCLSLETQLSQLLLPLAEQGELGSALDLAARGRLGGLGLLGQPDERLAGLLTEIQGASFVPVLVASDEEGGTVQRLASLLGPMPDAASSATTSSPADVEAAWLEYGSRVKALGIDVVFGPVLDVGGGPGIGSRSFGSDPATVAAYGGAVAAGLQQAGITPVFKHFPGHGRASGDSHLGLPVTPSIDELRARDLLPYRELVGDHRFDDAAVMVGHLSVPGLTTDLPTSLSPETINGLLKNEVGFGGLVFTDALNMGAIVDGFGTAEAVERSLIAGADIAILGSLSDVDPVLAYLVERSTADPGVAALIEQRVRRVLEAKGQIDICRGAQ